MDKRVAIVTGGSSGIGLWTARALRERGCIVYEFSRTGMGEEGIFHITCDVTDEQQVRDAVAQVVHEQGRLDLTVNCAGYGISGAVEFTEVSDARRQMDVNFFGMVNVNRASIPELRMTRGKIVNISSVAATAAIPFQTYYSASKAAINSYTLSLANELKPFGIRVCAVMPGDTATGFTDARRKNPTGDDVYGGKISASVTKMEKDERNGMPAEKAGQYIASVALSSRNGLLYTIGFSYKCINLLLKLLPIRVSNWLIGKLYA